MIGKPPASAPSFRGPVTLERLRVAIRASWDARTAYQAAVRVGNPAYGQCYPTARVVQCFFPDTEIACGNVNTGSEVECHFWNVRVDGDVIEHIDFSWEQFPPGSTVLDFRLLDRAALADSPATMERCALLLERAHANLGRLVDCASVG